MRRSVLTGLALGAGLLVPALAQAQTTPFGQGFDGWTFTATKEPNGVTACRATRKVGGREDIIGMRTNHTKPYISFKADGRKGKWPNVIIAVPGKPRGVLEWTTPGEANGIRMWFPLEFGAMTEIAAAGAVEWALPNTEDTATVNLGKRAGEAFERVNQCVNANGG